MREAVKIERETGRRIIHFEKGDFASPEFKPLAEAIEALTASLQPVMSATPRGRVYGL